MPMEPMKNFSIRMSRSFKNRTVAGKQQLFMACFYKSKWMQAGADLRPSSMRMRLKLWFSYLRATGISPWSCCFSSDTGYLWCSAAVFCWHPVRWQRLTGSPLLADLDWVAFLLANHLEGTESIKLMYCTCTFGNLHSKWNGHQVLATQFLSVLWYLMKCSKQTFTWGNIPPRAKVLPPPPLQGTPGSDGIIIFSKIMLIAVSTDTYFLPRYARRLH